MRRWFQRLRVEGAARKILREQHPDKKVLINPKGWSPKPFIIICDECGPVEIQALYIHPDHVAAMEEMHLADHMHAKHGGPDPWMHA